MKKLIFISMLFLCFEAHAIRRAIPVTIHLIDQGGSSYTSFPNSVYLEYICQLNRNFAANNSTLINLLSTSSQFNAAHSSFVGDADVTFYINDIIRYPYISLNPSTYPTSNIYYYIYSTILGTVTPAWPRQAGINIYFCGATTSNGEEAVYSPRFGYYFYSLYTSIFR